MGRRCLCGEAGILILSELKPLHPLDAGARTDGTLALRHSVYPETRFIEAERQTRRHLAVCGSITTVVFFYKQPQKRLKHSGHLGRVHGEKTRGFRLGLFLMGRVPMQRRARVAFTLSG